MSAPGLTVPMQVAMNVAPLTQPLTGIGRYVRELTRGLMTDPGVQLHGFDGRRWGAVQEVDVLPQPLRRTLRHWVRDHVPQAYPLHRAWTAWRFQQGARALGPALYHEPNFLALPFDGPLVLTVHDLSWIRHPETHPALRVRQLHRHFQNSLERADRIITVSQFVRKELIEVFGTAADRIIPIGLGAELACQPRPSAQTQSTLSLLNLRHGQYLLALGTLEPRKNPQTLLRAYAALPAALRDNYPLVWVGMPGWGDAVYPEAEALERAGQLRWTGYLSRDRVLDVLAGARLLAYPSLYEGFGLPVLEAMQAGVPVVTSRVSSLPEVAGDAALLVDPLDPQALREGLSALLEDENLRAQCIARGLQRSRLFGWNQTVRQTLAVYRSVLGAERD